MLACPTGFDEKKLEHTGRRGAGPDPSAGLHAAVPLPAVLLAAFLPRHHRHAARTRHPPPGAMLRSSAVSLSSLGVGHLGWPISSSGHACMNEVVTPHVAGVDGRGALSGVDRGLPRVDAVPQGHVRQQGHTRQGESQADRQGATAHGESACHDPGPQAKQKRVNLTSSE